MHLMAKMLGAGFSVGCRDFKETVLAMTPVRDTVVIVTDYGVYQATPSPELIFCLQQLARL